MTTSPCPWRGLQTLISNQDPGETDRTGSALKRGEAGGCVGRNSLTLIQNLDFKKLSSTIYSLYFYKVNKMRVRFELFVARF